MNDKYKSFEEKYFTELSHFSMGLYGGVAGFFRIPTTLRKYAKHQLLSQKFGKDELTSVQIEAMVAGISVGILADMGLLTYGMKSSEELFYAWIATNVASGIYELRKTIKERRKQSKLENSVKTGGE